MITPSYRVVIADELSPRAEAILSAHPEITVCSAPGLTPAALTALLNEDGGCHALAVRSATRVTAELLAAVPSLKVVGRAGIGVDNIDVQAASRRGIVVMNTPSGNAVTTAEHAICLLCALVRHIPQATASMRAGKWEKKRFQGTELCDKTLGIIGLGNIGRLVAERARGLKMNVIAHDPVTTQEAAARQGVKLVTLDELLAHADFISIHAPLLAETRNLIDSRAFAKMKQGVYLVHAARGGIVDETALVEAIDQGKIAGAALDVFAVEPPPKDHPLLAREQVIATPHLGASTEEAQEKVAIELAEQLVAFLLRGEVKNAVNLPSLAPEAQTRLQPYLDLAWRLGRIATQLCSGIETVDVELTGEIAESGTALVVATALAGILGPHLDMPVTAVNARMLADERGIHVSETRRRHGPNFTSAITLHVGARAGSHLVKGTVFHTADALESRLVQIDRFSLEAIPEGSILVIHNDDRPGVIGAVGTVLGRRGLNVSRMQVGLDRQTGQALQLWNVEGDVLASLDEIRAQGHVRSAQVISL